MINTQLDLKEVAFNTATSEIHGLTFNQKPQELSSDKVILFLHGWLDNAASFIPVFEHLKDMTEYGYQLIAIDLPGHGASSHKSEDAHYYFVDWIHDILALLEANNWTNVHLVGHSMGGMISSTFGATFPEKVKSITLIDSIGLLSFEEKETTNLLRKGILNRFKKPSESKKKLSIERAIKARMVISDLEYQHAEMIVSRNIHDDGNECKWRSDPKLNRASPFRFSLNQCKQIVSDIKAPVQVIYSTNGLDLVRKGLDVFSPLMQCKNIVELEGGHHVHMEKAQETAMLVKEFVKSI